MIEIRLGETDLTTSLDCRDPSISPSCVCDDGCPFTSEKECLEKKQCAERHVERGVAGKTIHPLYNPETLVWCKL